MRFKTLEITGFKSFADKTVLNFDSKMTAVIGSNGNGKSNISDALRWVMGEQGAKSLRSEKMGDVIFHGTEKRRQTGYARVALTVDNIDRALPHEADEVTVTRQLYRTGESEYFINGKPSRLKDISALFLGTGVGREGYSIVGQGKIAGIISSGTKERRDIFNEAAGVSRFLHQKDDAERELTKAGENLLRLEDIAKNLEERLPVLERQAEKALRYRELANEEETLEVSLSVHDLKNLEAEANEIADLIIRNEGEAEHFSREIAELEEEAEQLNDTKVKLTYQLDEIRRGETEKIERIGELETEMAVAENDKAHAEQFIRTLEIRIDNAVKGAAEFDEQAADLERQANDVKALLADTRGNVKEQNAVIAEMEQSGDQAAIRYRQASDSLVNTERDLAVKRTEKLKAADSLLESEQSKEREQQSAAERETSAESYRRQRREKKETLGDLEEELGEFRNKLSGFAILFEGKKAKLKQAEADARIADEQYGQKKARFDVLSNIERNMEGYGHAVKSVIGANRTGRLSGIFGTVADALETAKEYSVAIEVTLGAALQNIIVENENTAKRAILFLKETNGGRATFLPLSSVNGGELQQPGLEGEEGFVGIASRLVTYDDKYAGIVRSLLGRTAIAEDIDSASVIARKYGYRFKIVTLDGQVVNAGGSFTGGSFKKDGGIFSRKRELADIERDMKSLAEKAAGFALVRDRLKAETDKAALESEGLKDELSLKEKDIIRLTGDVSALTGLIEQCERSLTDSDTALSLAEAKEIAAKAALAEIDKSVAALETRLETLREEFAKAEKSVEEEGGKRGEAAKKLAALGLQELSLNKDLDRLTSEKNTLLDNKKNLAANVAELNAEIKEKQTEILKIEQAAKANAVVIATLSESRGEGKEESRRLSERLTESEQRVTDINRDIREKMTAREKFTAALERGKERKTGIERQIGDIVFGVLLEKYKLSRTEAADKAKPFTESDDYRGAKSRLVSIRKQIEELGDKINHAAIEELREVREQYGEMSRQIDDVNAARRSLEKLIDELTDRIREQFLENFTAINGYFGKVFREIFGGGHAELFLTEPDDVLSSGIEIKAAPPGKIIKNLISLSGGEQAMVAITIYFAILLHRPTPFCMLDEVDAALDEANVVKYASYLKRFSDKTQLLLITHRRGSIEECDVLYGVYMREKGVSSLIRQEITDDIALEE
ncbi:MAG: chromosome segregation protein SMC [Oscillospiraceae bacterium]|nr:chromosome segregation protein SMC [Oscillospiraceae bacterium]